MVKNSCIIRARTHAHPHARPHVRERAPSSALAHSLTHTEHAHPHTRTHGRAPARAPASANAHPRARAHTRTCCMLLPLSHNLDILYVTIYPMTLISKQNQDKFTPRVTPCVRNFTCVPLLSRSSFSQASVMFTCVPCG